MATQDFKVEYVLAHYQAVDIVAKALTVGN